MRKLLLIFIFSFFLFGFTCAEEAPVVCGVELTVDKEVYDHGEAVNVVFKNNLSSELVLDGLGFDLQKMEETGQWKGLPLHCSWPDCDIDHDVPHLAPGASKNTVWDQKIYLKLNSNYVQVEPGVYRVVWTYQVRKDADEKNWKWEQVYSKEFVVK